MMSAVMVILSVSVLVLTITLAMHRQRLDAMERDIAGLQNALRGFIEDEQ